jgi:hypothetical protein
LASCRQDEIWRYISRWPVRAAPSLDCTANAMRVSLSSLAPWCCASFVVSAALLPDIQAREECLGANAATAFVQTQVSQYLVAINLNFQQNTVLQISGAAPITIDSAPTSLSTVVAVSATFAITDSTTRGGPL